MPACFVFPIGWQIFYLSSEESPLNIANLCCCMQSSPPLLHICFLFGTSIPISFNILSLTFFTCYNNDYPAGTANNIVDHHINCDYLCTHKLLKWCLCSTKTSVLITPLSRLNCKRYVHIHTYLIYTMDGWRCLWFNISLLCGICTPHLQSWTLVTFGRVSQIISKYYYITLGLTLYVQV